jgi:hypothetical protein
MTRGWGGDRTLAMYRKPGAWARGPGVPGSPRGSVGRLAGSPADRARVPRSTVSEAETKSGADEFSHIPSRPRRPPLLTLLTLAVAVFLIVRLRHDVRYALSPSQPTDLGQVTALADRPLSRLPINRYVRLAGLPERESAVILDPRGSWEFSQLFRLHGARGRFFVRRAGDPLPPALAERDVFTGRLMRFSDLSFAGSIAHHFAERVKATHFFPARELAAALGRPARSLVVKDVGGDSVTLGPGDRLAFDVLTPGSYQIDMPRLRFAQRGQAEGAVQTAGGRVLSARETPEAWALTVALPDAIRDRALTALADLDRDVRFRAARETIERSPGEVQATPEGFALGQPGGGTVPFERVAAIRTFTTVRVPEDALLLLEGEVPRSQLKAVIILAVLVAFGTVSLLALRRPS